MSDYDSKPFREFEQQFQRYTEGNLRTDAATGSDAPCYLEDRKETDETFASKVAELHRLLGSARHCVVYTGAGISTSCGLPDYRGPSGLWTHMAAHPDDRKNPGAVLKSFDDSAGVAEPSAAHRWIARQVAQGSVKHVMSTNVDNLHVRSGLRRRMRHGEGADDGVTLSELHGNSFISECPACGVFAPLAECVPHAKEGADHAIEGVSCEACGGAVRDIVVGFHSTVEDAPSMEAEYDTAWVQCIKADVMLVFGSSLSVPTACDLVDEAVENNGCRVVIVNRQATPKDPLASLVIHADCDSVIEALDAADQQQSA